MSRNELGVFLVLVGVLLPWGSRRAQANNELLSVIETWKEQQDRFQSVRFEISGTVLEPAGYALAPVSNDYQNLAEVPSRTEEVPIRSSVLFDFSQGRLRRHLVKRTSIWVAKAKEHQFFPFDQVVMYNGKQWKSYTPHELNLAKAPVPDLKGTELAIYEKRPRCVVFDVEHNPLLYTCGIIHTGVAFDPKDFRPVLRESSFRLGGYAKLDGNECLILRTVPDQTNHHFEFWVDKHDHRIIRQTMGYRRAETNPRASRQTASDAAEPDKLWLRTRISYNETEHGPVPANWRVEKTDFMTNKAAVYKMKLDKFEANPVVADADFDIDPRPGMRVTDQNLPRDARNFVVGAPGKPNLPIAEVEAQQGRQQARTRMFIGICVVVLLLAGAAFFWRRRSRT